MGHWVWTAIIVEAMALASWAAGSVTGKVKYAFLFGFNVMLPVAGFHFAESDRFDWRIGFAAASVVLYVLQMNVVILLWTKDTAMSKLDDRLGAGEKRLLPFVMTNAAGFLYCLPFYFVGRRSGPFDWRDALAVLSFTLGTVIHFAADLQKRRFKANPSSHGRLLDRGLWRFSRHPNYFGDLMVYVGWALFAANPWAWLSPAANLAQYLFDAIPKSEKWAAERYGQAWSDYATRTSRLVPWMGR